MPLPPATPRMSPEKLAQARARHARRRLKALRVICPHLPDDVLTDTSLHTLSVAVRRAGRRLPAQTSLNPATQEFISEAEAPNRHSPDAMLHVTQDPGSQMLQIGGKSHGLQDIRGKLTNLS